MLAAITLILAQAASASPLIHLECETVSPRGVHKERKVRFIERGPTGRLIQPKGAGSPNKALNDYE